MKNKVLTVSLFCAISVLAHMAMVYTGSYQEAVDGNYIHIARLMPILFGAILTFIIFVVTDYSQYSHATLSDKADDQPPG